MAKTFGIQTKTSWNGTKIYEVINLSKPVVITSKVLEETDRKLFEKTGALPNGVTSRKDFKQVFSTDCFEVAKQVARSGQVPKAMDDWTFAMSLVSIALFGGK
jgi:hypothetical protein